MKGFHSRRKGLTGAGPTESRPWPGNRGCRLGGWCSCDDIPWDGVCRVRTGTCVICVFLYTLLRGTIADRPRKCRRRTKKDEAGSHDSLLLPYQWLGTMDSR